MRLRYDRKTVLLLTAVSAQALAGLLYIALRVYGDGSPSEAGLTRAVAIALAIGGIASGAITVRKLAKRLGARQASDGPALRLERFYRELFGAAAMKELDERLVDEIKTDLKDERETPSWMLRFLFHVHENERKRIAQDLHDAALQEQIVWYRKLDALLDGRELPDDIRAQLKDISEGLLDVVHQIRLTAYELRPPMLRQLGLVDSLEELFKAAEMRTNLEIDFDASGFHYEPGEEPAIGVYRIVQELLANAAKHAKADTIRIRLTGRADTLELHYRDNGIGLPAEADYIFTGMGLYGIQERVRSLNGEFAIHSAPGQGLSVSVTIPVRSERGDLREAR